MCLEALKLDEIFSTGIYRTCNRCGDKLNADLFYRAEGFTHGLDSLCKECRYIVDGNGVETLTAKQIKKLVHQKKDRAVCEECGAAGMPAKAMRLVYRKGEMKSFSLSKPPRELDMVSIIAELKKCDLLCANCASMRR